MANCTSSATVRKLVSLIAIATSSPLHLACSKTKFGAGQKSTSNASSEPSKPDPVSPPSAGSQPLVNTKPNSDADTANPNQKSIADATTGQVADCSLGYPFHDANNPRTEVSFDESEIIIASSATLGANDSIRVYYSDEHALMLGIYQINQSGGTSKYPISPSPQNGVPGLVTQPQVGATDINGANAGVDTLTCGEPDCGRPMYPALFITDITTRPQSLAGDWQFHGIPIPPDAVLGVWKGSTRSVDSSGTASIKVDADPHANHFNIGPGETFPTAQAREFGFTAELKWNVANLKLESGHTYRAQFMVHDGDQNRSGGDVGQGCALIKIK